MAKVFNAFSSRATTVVLILLLFGLLIVGRDIAVDARLQKDVAVEKVSYSNEPVELDDIKISEKVLKLGEKIAEHDDWLKKLSFKLKNKTDKSIVYAEVDLDFPETKSSGSQMAYVIRFGQRPGTINQTRAPLLIPPGKSLNIVVENDYNNLKKFVEERQSISSLSKAAIRISMIAFDDGTAWLNGSMVRLDPNNPLRYIPIEDN